MFCQDDIKIARETHYGSLYIDASGRKYLGQNSRRVKSIGRLGLDWTQTYWVLTGTIQMQCIEACNSFGDDKEQLCCNWYCIYSACIRLGWWGVTRSSINYWRGVAVLTTLLHLGGEGEWKGETIQLNHKQQPRSESFLSYIKRNLYIKWNLSVEGTSSFEL